MSIQYLKLPYKSILRIHQIERIIYHPIIRYLVNFLPLSQQCSIFFTQNFVSSYFHCSSTQHPVRKLNEHSFPTVLYKYFVRIHHIDLIICHPMIWYLVSSITPTMLDILTQNSVRSYFHCPSTHYPVRKLNEH